MILFSIYTYYTYYYIILYYIILYYIILILFYINMIWYYINITLYLIILHYIYLYYIILYYIILYYIILYYIILYAYICWYCSNVSIILCRNNPPLGCSSTYMSIASHLGPISLLVKVKIPWFIPVIYNHQSLHSKQDPYFFCGIIPWKIAYIALNRPEKWYTYLQ